MAETLHLTEEGEEIWTRFSTHMQFSGGFGLFVIFSSFPGLINLFRERLELQLQFQVNRLQPVRTEEPLDLPDHLLALIREEKPGLREMRAPLWVEFWERGDETDRDSWEKARVALLHRLNLQRDLLRSRLSRPFILVLPGDYRPHIREIAPDFWSVRTHNFILDSSLLSTTPPAQFFDVGSRDPGKEPTIFHPELAEAMLREWQRVKDRSGPGVIQAGFHAVDVTLEMGQGERGKEIAERVLELARAAAKTETPEALRDLSISLNKAGAIQEQLGELEGAEKAFGESLEISRRLLQSVGESPQALRDLAVSLEKVGDIRQALGQLEGAEEMFGRSLEVFGRLHTNLGDTPQALWGVATSNWKCADSAKSLGKTAAAREYFQESLQLWEKLAESYPQQAEHRKWAEEARKRLAELEEG
ncbi:MAG: tetratricopeptide repeat protein [Magnetococcales bacterium]|nr:tetratricopeptide repeat protein [Magnetococcales bacterium]